MSANTVIHPKGWAPAKGYANGILSPEGILYVGGQIGWNANQIFEHHDFIGQMEQTLRNVLDVVEAAGGQAADITRLTWFVTSKKTYLAHQREIGEVYRKVMGRNFPAMSMLVVADLIEDQALLEIEATAHIAKGPPP
jgi:enamine deaminase RidA (YjgF/YER057c/UK114 family)